jgi:hypothetical protein
MRALLILAASPLLATFAPLSLSTTPALPTLTTLAFQPLPLDRKDPARRTIGKLDYLSGWAISSNDRRFGGISAMHVDGQEVIALSDAGSVIRFPLPGRRAPAADIFPVPSGPGASAKKDDRDVEAMAVHKQMLWLAFEGANEIWRYSRGAWKGRSSAAPPAMKDWPLNGGSEAMLRLADGRFLVFREGKAAPDGTSEAILFDGDPADPKTASAAVRYRPPTGYRITDAATLPDGRLVFLNRRFGLPEAFTAKLTLAPKPEAGAIELLSGEEIAHLELPLPVDNMEALSVTREGGRVILWIASDDNLNPIQRTILLKLALRE